MQNSSNSIRVGTDIVEVARIKRAIHNSGEGFLRRVFTEKEIAFTAQQYERLAGCWAAKEAAVKALGTGFQQKITFQDIEITHDSAGAPHLIFTGQFAELAEKQSIKNCSVSISHTEQIAIAVVMLF